MSIFLHKIAVSYYSDFPCSTRHHHSITLRLCIWLKLQHEKRPKKAHIILEPFSFKATFLLNSFFLVGGTYGWLPLVGGGAGWRNLNLQINSSHQSLPGLGG